MGHTEGLSSFASAAQLNPSLWNEYQYAQVVGLGDLPLAQPEEEILAGRFEPDFTEETGVRQVFIGNPFEVVVSLLPSLVLEIAEFDGIWKGTWPLYFYRRIEGRVVFPPLPPQATAAEITERTAEVKVAIDCLSKVRREKSIECKRCGEIVPPERQVVGGICQDCAGSNVP